MSEDTLEQRVERLEMFIGNMEKIKTVYGNSLQEVCDKYLNLLYIETPVSGLEQILILDGFLADLTSISSLPHNVVFNVRPSHNFAYVGGTQESKIRFKRDNEYIDLPLKKFDIEHPGNLIYLAPNDYMNGMIYSVYINSQNIAVISSSDTGVIALQEIATLESEVDDLALAVTNLSTSLDTTALTASNATIGSLTVSSALSISQAFSLPTGSTCSAPTANTHVANKKYVDDTISAEINAFYNSHHLFGDPNTLLANAPEKAICYKY